MTDRTTNVEADLLGAATQLDVDGMLDLRLQDPDRRHRFDLNELDVRWDEATQTLWSFMTPTERPNFNRAMLRDLNAWQVEIARAFTPSGDSLRYLVLGSRFPGVFNLGGDLDYVAGCIGDGNAEALIAYGNACVQILYNNFIGNGLPIVTIALIQGDCFGGGFESALSFDVLVAEKGAKFALPETAFGMFPGVGAHSLLTRRLSAVEAERLMMSGRTYTAEDMHDLGLVHILAEPGEGERAVDDYIHRNGKRQTGHCGIYRASREVNPITLDELQRIVGIWAETALSLRPQDVKMMRRLVEAQAKLFSERATAPA